MSGRFNHGKSGKIDRFIRSCPTKEIAWRFFLRRNLRSEGFYRNASHAIISASRAKRVEKLRNQFEKTYGRYFIRPLG